jgi:hypothetical protein
VAHEMRSLRAPDLVLAGHAGDVRTGAPDPSALHHGGSPSGSRHMPSDELACRSAAKHQDFELLRLDMASSVVISPKNQHVSRRNSPPIA